MKKYKTTVDLLTDLSLNQTDVDFIFDYIVRFGPVAFDKESRVLIINSKILNLREDVKFEGEIFKIRLEYDSRT